MAGTLYINDETVWMPAGWVFDGVLELIGEELKAQGKPVAEHAAGLLSARTEADCVCDLSKLDATQFQLLAQAAERAYERLVAEGPGAFHHPAFYRGFMAHFARLNELLQANTGVAIGKNQGTDGPHRQQQSRREAA